MDKTEFNMSMQTILEADTLDAAAAITLIGNNLKGEPKVSIAAFISLTQEIVKRADLAAAVQAMAFYASRSEELKSSINLDQMREVIRRSATTAEQKVLVDSIGLPSALASAIAKRLGVLIALKPGVYVQSQSWGFGCISAVDTFYGKVTIDFESKKDHVMTLAVAGQNLSIAADNHIMTQFLKDRTAVAEMAEKHPANLVREMLRSYGPMPIVRLQDRLAQIGLVPENKWKAFWESARRSLKADKSQCAVEIPTKRSENLVLSDELEAFGAKWLARFAKERDIKVIYTQVQAYLFECKDTIAPSYKDVIGERLNFALKGADKVDYARYAQVAVLLRKCGYSTPEEQLAQADTLLLNDETDNFLAAMHGSSARDVSAMVSFILAVKPEAKPVVLDHLDQLGSVALGATLSALAGLESAENIDPKTSPTAVKVRELLKRSAAPVPTLVVWALRNRKEAAAWQAPALPELLIQAVHVVEQRLTGENLKMRNALQGFFDSASWLEGVVAELSAFDRKVLFERIQASSTWETRSQRNILVRMVRFDKTLAEFRHTIKTEPTQEHFTSQRSMTAFKLAFDNLVNVEIPANTHDISRARSFGDLRENAEYQYAKDHQRVLISRQEEMNRTLNLLKVKDFTVVTVADEVVMGAEVSVKTAAGVTTYTILGELDRDEKLNIISCRSRLAIALLGHRTGDIVEIPAEHGTIQATITGIGAMREEVRAWLAKIPTTFNAKA